MNEVMIPQTVPKRPMNGAALPVVARKPRPRSRRRVSRDPVQPSLGLLDAVVRRNGWGRQVDSFETQLAVVGWNEPLEAVFIRAPRFVDLGPQVEVLARVGPEPVLVRQDRILAGTFHPELSGDDRLHGAFLDLAARRAAPAGRRRDGQQARSRSIGRSTAP